MSWDDRITPQLDAFGEALTVRTPAGATRSVMGVVDRGPRRQMPNAPRVNRAGLIVTLKNDAAAGIASTEAVLNFQIDVAERVGGTAMTREVIGIIEQDEHLLILDVA